MTKKDRNYVKSLKEVRKWLPKLNHTNVHMYIWFTNLPSVGDEKDLPLHQKSPAGITGKASNPVICKSKNVALVRGPSRLDQNTAGVSAKHFYQLLPKKIEM